MIHSCLAGRSGLYYGLHMDLARSARMALRLGHCTSDFIQSKHYWRCARCLSFPVFCGDQDAVP